MYLFSSEDLQESQIFFILTQKVDVDVEGDRGSEPPLDNQVAICFLRNTGIDPCPSRSNLRGLIASRGGLLIK